LFVLFPSRGLGTRVGQKLVNKRRTPGAGEQEGDRGLRTRDSVPDSFPLVPIVPAYQSSFPLSQLPILVPKPQLGNVNRNKINK